MEKFRIVADEHGIEFLTDIAKKMIELFGISEEEAIGRINKHWEGAEFIGEEKAVYHEDDEYWAKTIYFGKDSFWWLKEGEHIDPIPYP